MWRDDTHCNGHASLSLESAIAPAAEPPSTLRQPMWSDARSPSLYMRRGKSTGTLSDRAHSALRPDEDKATRERFEARISPVTRAQVVGARSRLSHWLRTNLEARSLARRRRVSRLVPDRQEARRRAPATLLRRSQPRAHSTAPPDRADGTIPSRGPPCARDSAPAGKDWRLVTCASQVVTLLPWLLWQSSIHLRPERPANTCPLLAQRFPRFSFSYASASSHISPTPPISLPSVTRVHRP
ncbi:hypothetical protein C8Q76DRAFT_437693 [Earliella scabrosa]|nr:hypothetical protein C8Q76DRAFT_437693 [Earliella scabrosa]